MRKKRAKIFAVISTVIIGTNLVGCGFGNVAQSEVIDNAEIVDSEDSKSTEDTESNLIEASYDEEDIDATWDEASATKISLNDSEISVDGDGASVNGSIVTITEAGTYVVSGSISDGQIRVEATNEDRVRLVLDGAEITSTNSAAIYVLQADKTTIILADGTTNVVSDGKEYVYDDTASEEEAEPNAAIFSKDDLFFTGTGNLMVNGNFNNAIQSKDDLVVASGNYNVSCVNNGFHGKDSLTILDGTYTVDAGHNAFSSKDYLLVESGTYIINAEKKGFHGDTQVIINDGDIDILSCYEGIESMKITINGGDINLVASDDGLNAAESNEDTTEEAESDDVIINEDGTTTTKEMQEMGKMPANMTNGEGQSQMSSKEVPVEMANAEIPTDIANGEIPPEMPEEMANGEKPNMQGGGMFENVEGCEITINGGKVVIDAGGDGIDTNGSYYQNGGEVYVNGPENSGNGALDYNGDCNISGGILVAAGGAGMAQSPSSNSSQAGIMISTSIEDGTVIAIKDDTGEEVFNYTFVKKAECAYISCENMTTDKTYTIVVNGTETGNVTLGEIITTVDETGTSVNIGTMNPGGGMGRGNRGQMNPQNQSQIETQTGTTTQ